MNDHDQRLKTLLKKFLQEFIQLFFPKWVARFDWSTVEWLEQEIFLDPPRVAAGMSTWWRNCHCWSPSSPPHAPESYVILIHVEIESADSVADVPDSVFGYYSGLRAKHGLPVFPIALYLQVGLDGIGWGIHEEFVWEESFNRFRYPYIGLPALDARAYVDGPNLLGVAAVLMRRCPKNNEPKSKPTQCSVWRLHLNGRPPVFAVRMCRSISSSGRTEFERVRSIIID